jgi:hypothetical protein
MNRKFATLFFMLFFKRILKLSYEIVLQSQNSYKQDRGRNQEHKVCNFILHAVFKETSQTFNNRALSDITMDHLSTSL